MKNSSTLAVIIALLFIGTSCEKDDVYVPSGKCNISSENIVGSYKIIGATYTLNATADRVDFMDELYKNRLCAKDDLLTFKANGVLTITDAGEKCTPTTEASKSWRLDEQKLMIAGEKEAIVYEIFCHNNILYLKYFNWYKDGDEVMVVYQKQL